MAATYQVNLSESLKVLWLRSTSDPSKVTNKQFTKHWVVLSSHLPGEASLHFYTSKSAVLHSPAVYVETVSEMTDVCHLGYSKKQLILQLNYTQHSILLMFSSAVTMNLWKDKLKAFINCHPLFLLKCPHKVFQSGHYIVSYSDDTLFVYSTKTNELAWKWHVGQLRRYSYEPSVPFIEIEAGRSSETGEGKFFFSGKRSRQLYDLLESLSISASSTKRFSNCSNSLGVATNLPRSISNSIAISRSVGELSRSLDTPRTNGYTHSISVDNAPRLPRSVSSSNDLCRSADKLSSGMDVPKTDSAGYLTVLCPMGASPLANRKFYMDKNRSLPTNSSGHVNGKTNATAPTATNQNCSHRVRPPFSPSSSLDIEDSVHRKVLSGPRSHSIPDVKETFQSGSFLQGCSGLTKSRMHTPAINIATMDFNAYDDISDDDDDDDYYVNDEEFSPAMLPINAQQY